MSGSGTGPSMVVISGPIGAGKSTVAQALAQRLRSRDRTVATIDLDAVVAMIGGFDGLPAPVLREAREVHGRLVGAWFDHGADIVVHGPFHTTEDEATLLREVPAGLEPLRVRLLVSYEVALQRVLDDEMPRNRSRDPTFLRNAHERSRKLTPSGPAADLIIDTEAIAPDETAAMILARLEARSPREQG